MDINRPQVNRAQPQPARNGYGVPVQPLAQTVMPSPAYGRPLAPMTPQPPQPQLSSPAALVQRGAQMQGQYKPQTPWAGNPAYGNVQLPATEYGPNQSAPQVRDRIAGRLDPTSWATYTRTPGEINQQIGNRAESHLADLRQRPDLSGARSQYQISPVTSLARPPAVDPALQQAQRQQEIARYRQEGLAKDARLAADPTAQLRFKTMNDPGVDFNARQYRGQLAQATAMYNTYAREARFSGDSPMSYDNFLSQYQAGHLSPEAKGLLQQGRQVNQQATQNRKSRGPSLQFAQYMNQRYGMPMALPDDPQMAQQWQNSLAMQGNPYAAQSNLMNQQQMAMMAQTNATNMAQLQNTMAQQAGLNLRAGLQSQPGLTPDQRSQVITHWAQHDPETKRKQAYDTHMEPYMRSGEWATADRARREEIMSQAQRRGDEAARAAEATRGMMARSFGEVTGPYGLNSPAAGPVVAPPPGGQTPTRDPAQPALSQGSPFFMGGKSLPAETGQPQPQSNPANQYGIDPNKNIPTAQPPGIATSEDLQAAYSSVKRFNNGKEPTMDQIQQHLKEHNKAIPQYAEDSGETRPYWSYKNGITEDYHRSPDGTGFLNWLEANRGAFGAAPKQPLPSFGESMGMAAPYLQ